MAITAGEITVNFIGNVVGDPELRFTQGGAAVVDFRVACTERRFNRDTNQWVDAGTTYLSVIGWRQLAENVTETIKKGQSVLVMGLLRSRQYENREGQKVTVFEVHDPFVGPSLQYQSAVVTKNPPTGQSQARTAPAAAAAAPMASTPAAPTPAPAPRPAAGPGLIEPPF